MATRLMNKPAWSLLLLLAAASLGLAQTANKKAELDRSLAALAKTIGGSGPDRYVSLRDQPELKNLFAEYLKRNISIDCADFPVTWYLAGDFYQENGQWDQAVRCYTRALELGYSADSVLRYRSMVYARLGDFAKAVADMDKALELSPDEPGLYEARADIYHKKGDYRRAISDYTDAIKIRRHRVKEYKDTYLMLDREWEFLMETIFSRAQTFLAMKSYDQAIDDFRFIENQTKAGPGKASLFRTIADVYRIKGDTKRADKYLRKADAQESKINK